MTESEIWENLNKIADLLAKQEWAKIIPEIPQTDREKTIRATGAKNKKNRSPYGEERM